MLIVHKYGGTSVADGACIENAAKRIVKAVHQGHQVIAVVSAQGDLTDRLLEKIRQIDRTPSARESDACVSAGEQISAALVAMAVQKLGVPAVSLMGWQAGLVTDDAYGNARIRYLKGDRIQKELDRGNVVVVAGFQGIDQHSNVTTLGRGGSDTTAVALTALVKADRCIIFTDVAGVYDKDPRKNPDAKKYAVIGYDEMLALCNQGAQVLHDRCVEMAKQCRICLEVKSAFDDSPGTIVGDLY